MGRCRHASIDRAAIFPYSCCMTENQPIATSPAPRLPVIAIDGPTASGKGTLARRLATALDFACLDTGLLYRAVGLSVMRAGLDPANHVGATTAAQTLDMSMLGDPMIRMDDAGQAASIVSTIPAVRSLLFDLQRNFAINPPDSKKGAVLDGRDIGTVICPDATVKLYVTADAKVRADRRHKELQSRGKNVSYEAVLEDIKVRDERDMNRAIAPLKPAADAIMLDTSDMTADQAFAEALLRVRQVLGI